MRRALTRSYRFSAYSSQVTFWHHIGRVPATASVRISARTADERAKQSSGRRSPSMRSMISTRYRRYRLPHNGFDSAGQPNPEDRKGALKSHMPSKEGRWKATLRRPKPTAATERHRWRQMPSTPLASGNPGHLPQDRRASLQCQGVHCPLPWRTIPKPKWNLHRHRIVQRCQHRHTGLRRCDEGFCSFRLRKLTHCRLLKQTLGFS